MENISPIPDEVYWLAEAVADLAASFAHAERHPNDSRELPRLVIEWARLFEDRHAGFKWDGEYIEEIDDFFVEQYAAWVASGAPTIPNPMR